MSTPIPLTSKSVILKPGESFILPPGSSVQTVIGLLSSTGCTLPPPTNYVNHIFYYDIPLDITGSTTPYWVGVKYGNDKYFFENAVLEGNLNSVHIYLANALKSFANINPIIRNVEVGPFGPDAFQGNVRYSIKFDIAESYLNNFFFIKKDAVQGDTGQGHNATQVVYYVSIINE